MARSRDHYDSRLLGREIVSEASREPYWFVLKDRLDLQLADLAMLRAPHISSAWIAWQFGSSRPRVMHAHMGHVAAIERPLAHALGCPLIVSFYGADASLHGVVRGRQFRTRYRRLFEAVGAVIVEGPALGERVERLGCPPERIHVVRLPADEEGLQDCEEPKADHFLVTLAGRFAEKKGFDDGIRVFARAFKDRHDAKLLVIGGGELEGQYRRLAADEGIEDRVEWGGRLPFKEFMRAISRAHVALYPSRTAPDGDSEGGAPVTLIEAQWLGVPSIVSDHDDLPFVAAPEGSIALPATELDQWVDALRALYDEPQRVSEMREAARAFARANHGPAANARARETVYDSTH